MRRSSIVIFGNTSGLPPLVRRRLINLYRRRQDPQEIISGDMARSLISVSKEIGREVGVIINRKGQVEAVVVGDKRGIKLPDLDENERERALLCGLRFIHTHLNGEFLSREDLSALALKRMDLVGCIFEKKGEAGELFHGSYLVPSRLSNEMWEFIGPCRLSDLSVNFLDFINDLETEFLKIRGKLVKVKGKEERCVLVCVFGPNSEKDPDESIPEMISLCESAGLKVLDTIVQKPKSIHPGYLIGRGKLEEVIMRSISMDADVIVFDEELSPSQLKNISDLTSLKVLDRNQLILDIFATKAKTKEAKVQVELAQLRYILPRLTEKNTAFSRLTGGIGGRGPGETKLEIDRRRIRDRISLLEKRLDEIKRVRETKRLRRKDSPYPVVSIVGYANSGKSSLLNLLTRSKAEVDPKPFSTLSPTTRLIKYPERKEILLSDTVGLIRNLPETLFNAFLSTFEELNYADLLIHLVDASEEDVEKKIESVEQVLKRLGLDHKRRILVFNKIDKLKNDDIPLIKNLEKKYNAVSISCKMEVGIDRLLKRIEEELDQLKVC